MSLPRNLRHPGNNKNTKIYPWHILHQQKTLWKTSFTVVYKRQGMILWSMWLAWRKTSPISTVSAMILDIFIVSSEIIPGPLRLIELCLRWGRKCVIWTLFAGAKLQVLPHNTKERSSMVAKKRRLYCQPSSNSSETSTCKGLINVFQASVIHSFA